MFGLVGGHRLYVRKIGTAFVMMLLFFTVVLASLWPVLFPIAIVEALDAGVRPDFEAWLFMSGLAWIPEVFLAVWWLIDAFRLAGMVNSTGVSDD